MTQILMDKLNTVRQIGLYGLKINVKKTKLMCISCIRTNKIKIMIGRVTVEQVDCFRYCCSVIAVLTVKNQTL